MELQSDPTILWAWRMSAAEFRFGDVDEMGCSGSSSSCGSLDLAYASSLRILSSTAGFPWSSTHLVLRAVPLTQGPFRDDQTMLPLGGPPWLHHRALSPETLQHLQPPPPSRLCLIHPAGGWWPDGGRASHEPRAGLTWMDLCPH